MADSLRELILQNVETTLEGITTGAGYEQTVNHVVRGKLNPGTPEQYPLIVIYEAPMTAETEHYGSTTKHLQLSLEVWTKSGGDNPSVVINKLLADIEKALEAAPTRGGYAIDTWYLGDELVFSTTDDSEIGALVFIQINFRNIRTNPYSLV